MEARLLGDQETIDVASKSISSGKDPAAANDDDEGKFPSCVYVQLNTICSYHKLIRSIPVSFSSRRR